MGLPVSRVSVAWTATVKPPWTGLWRPGEQADPFPGHWLIFGGTQKLYWGSKPCHLPNTGNSTIRQQLKPMVTAPQLQTGLSLKRVLPFKSLSNITKVQHHRHRLYWRLDKTITKIKFSSFFRQAMRQQSTNPHLLGNIVGSKHRVP